jgi:hypothetical protein
MFCVKCCVYDVLFSSQCIHCDSFSIGAKVIDGVYTLIDPTETIREDDDIDDSLGRQRSGSVTDRNTIRMPPSLTLSKIRSMKQQALMACIRSKIEISTLALACVYFERLCLDCRGELCRVC